MFVTNILKIVTDIVENNHQNSAYCGKYSPTDIKQNSPTRL